MAFSDTIPRTPTTELRPEGLEEMFKVGRNHRTTHPIAETVESFDDTHRGFATVVME